jgi:hypothetical protein
VFDGPTNLRNELCKFLHRITKFVTNINSFLNNRIHTWLWASTNYFSTTTKALTLSVKEL